MEKPLVIVLAAGLGKRTGSTLPKVLLETSESRPLLSYVFDSLAAIEALKIVTVVGYQKELVESRSRELWKGSSPLEFAVQSEQRGTGDAVRAAKNALLEFQGPVLITCGDMPLISGETIRQLLQRHHEDSATITLLTLSAGMENDFGRIFRDELGNILSIIEKKDCDTKQLLIPERNAGVYCIESSFLLPALDRLTTNNAQAEYYLTDIVAMAAKEAQRISNVEVSDRRETLGVNDRLDLLKVSEAIRQKRIEVFARAGVQFLAPDSVILGPDVLLEDEVKIGPSVEILGNTSIGARTVIEGSARINNTRIAADCHIRLGAYLNDAIVETKVTIGPFVQVRPGTQIGRESRIGNFVELKNATLENNVSANHLSYLGDCSIGEGSNIGAGTITCNYDGVKKSRTIVGKGVFVGSNTALVAPVEIGEGAMIGAGSVITKSVAADALALARAPQVEKAGWAKRRKSFVKK